jgi:diguanylate cyclase (GGDEF)-like protein
MIFFRYFIFKIFRGSLMLNIFIILFFLINSSKVYGFTFETVVSGNYPLIGTYEAKFVGLNFLNEDVTLTKIYNELILKLKYEQAIEKLIEFEEYYLSTKNDKLISDYYMLLGYCCFNISNMENAKKYLEMSINKNKENYISYYILGNLYFTLGDNNKAIEYLEQSVKIEPTFVIARRVLAQIYVDLRKYNDGIRQYQEIVNLLPNSGYYLYQLYNAYYKAEQYEKAKEVLEKMIKLQPNLYFNYVRLVELVVKLKDFENAKKIIEQKLINNPDDNAKFEGYYYLANIYFVQDDLKNALKYIDLAKKIKYNQNLEILEYKVKEKMKSELRNFLLKIIFLLLILFFISLLAVLIYLYNSQRELISMQRQIDKAAEEADNLEYLCSLLVGNLSKVIPNSEFISLLLYNSNSNTLYTISNYGNVPDELRKIQILVNYDSKEIIERKLISTELISIKSLSNRLYNMFNELFPSLLERALKNGVNYIIPVIDKRNLKGIILLKIHHSINFLRIIEINQKIGIIIPRMVNHIDSFIFHESIIIDETTTLYNRKYFENAIVNELKRSERYSQHLSLIICDLDNFKKINDTFGHLVGDKVLRETAKIIKNNIRDGIDVAARWGGEEFVIVLPFTDVDSAYKIAERIRVNINSYKYSGLPENYVITASFGLATYPVHAKTKNDLFKKADEAAYISKKNGKNRVTIATIDQSESKSEIKNIDSSREPRIDPITNLYTYNDFMFDLEKEIKRCRRYSLPMSLIFLKAIILTQAVDNDIVNNIVSKLGNDIKKYIRFAVDLAAFDKSNKIFILMLPHTEKSKAIIVANRLYNNLMDYGTILQAIVSFPDDSASHNGLVSKGLKLIELATIDEPIQYISI